LFHIQEHWGINIVILSLLFVLCIQSGYI
jgi:hypothetical protein